MLNVFYAIDERSLPADLKDFHCLRTYQKYPPGAGDEIRRGLDRGESNLWTARFVMANGCWKLQSVARPPRGLGASVPAQVRTFHFLVCAERVAFIMQDDSAGLKDVAVMGNLQCEISVLFDEKNRDA